MFYFKNLTNLISKVFSVLETASIIAFAPEYYYGYPWTNINLSPIFNFNKTNFDAIFLNLNIYVSVGLSFIC